MSSPDRSAIIGNRLGQKAWNAGRWHIENTLVELMTPIGLAFYAGICGWTLARAHARSGNPVAIAAYLGGSDAFDRSITDFSQRYADQNEPDYQEFMAAVRSGRLEALEGV